MEARILLGIKSTYSLMLGNKILDVQGAGVTKQVPSTSDSSFLG